MTRILVIDDESLLRSTVCTILNREGFSVESACDGDTGIASVRKNPPDVVITDIFMPNKDGIEIVMELKRYSPEIKIIAMTGGGEARMMEISQAAQLLGADRVLRKPFDKDTLLAALKEVLKNPPNLGSKSSS